jgi:AcrR family transcriptional regulator
MLQPTPHFHSSSSSNGTPSSSPPTTTRDSILDAAGVLLGRFGYHKTTMDDLAREAGVARRTLYLHFRSKDEIFLERIDRVVERLLSELRAIASGPGSAEERLRRMVIERVLYRFDTVRGYVQSLDEIFQALRQPYLQRREGYFVSESALFARVLEEGVRAGELVVDDPQETARAFIAATSGLIPYSLSPKELGSRRDIERTTQRISELLVSGLRKPGTRSGI